MANKTTDKANEIVVEKLQLEGKKEMSLAEFKNGYPDFKLFA